MPKKQGFSKPFNLVCENNYPNLLLGPGIYTDFADAKASSPTDWIKSNIKDIEKNRNKQVFSFAKYSKEAAQDPTRELSDIQLITQSIKTTELEIDFTEKERKVSDEVTGLSNTSFDFENLKIVDDIKVPKPIEKTVNDRDFNAREGMIYLYQKIDDVYKIEQLLSVGLLGIKRNRLLVPTRWTITSVDDTIGKELINKIKINQTIDKYELHFFEFYKNKFYVIMLPLTWGFEMIENAGGQFTIDHELYDPRKDYAINVMGGYYAARLEIAKRLEERKRLARVIVLRDMDPTYSSKGVWVIREAVKEAMAKEPLVFETLESLLNHINSQLLIRNSIKYWTDASTILKENKMQKRLFEFI